MTISTIGRSYVQGDSDFSLLQDADILWLRNPFDHFASNADFQISCDKNRGDEMSLLNRPNCGYQHARSNNRTIAMYRHWCEGGDENPDIDEQSLLKRLLQTNAFASYKVKIRFLSTERFSGFCQVLIDCIFNLSKPFKGFHIISPAPRFIIIMLPTSVVCMESLIKLYHCYVLRNLKLDLSRQLQFCNTWTSVIGECRALL